MIKHIVMIALPNAFDQQKRTQKAREIKALLDQLPKIVSEIKFYEVGINIKPANSPNFHDLILLSTFNNMLDLKNYIINPEHVKVVELIKNEGCTFTSVDFEI